MTDDTPSKDDPFAMDESAAHHAVAGRTGSGKTTRLIEHMATIYAESDPEWIDPKSNDEDVTSGGD